MAKVSPARTSFNAGEFSPLVEGRVDLDRYPASLRNSKNFVAAPQGPAIRRSGTQYIASAFSSNPDTRSRLIPFVFSEEQAFDIEFAQGRVRFILAGGVQTYSPITAKLVGVSQFEVIGHTYNVGDQMILNGFPPQYNANGGQANVIGVSGNNVSVDFDTNALPVNTTGTAARVYHVLVSYNNWEVIRKIKAVQDGDVLFLFCEGVPPCKLSRYGAYDWRFELNYPKFGPYMPVEGVMGSLFCQDAGKPLFASWEGSASTDTAVAYAFDDNPMSSWEGAASQQGTLGFLMTEPAVMTGYVFHPQQTSPETDYTPLERAPGTWQLLGKDGAGDWHVLDTQTDFQAYEMGRSVLITFENTTAYYGYKWVITACKRNGVQKPRLATITMRWATSAPFTFVRATLSANSTINKGQKFLATDVGRAIRVRDIADGMWRHGVIASVTDSSNIVFQLLSENFIGSGVRHLQFQLGYYSNTTGWPFVGAFFEDRLWMGGSTEYPDLVSASRVGAYNDFETRTNADEVLDDSAMAFRMRTARLSAIRWMDSDERGLLIGDGSREHIISPASTDGAVTARNIKRRSSTQRGSARYVDQIKIDRQILFVQNGNRNVRELAYQYEADGYKAPSMTLFSSHLASKQYMEAAYQQEPYSVIWFRTATDELVGLTYNREENVIGWHAHDLNGEVETISCTPNAATKQDQLTLIVRRELPGGESRRTIERLVRFWDFQDTVQSAHFVDCALRYQGAAVNKVYNLRHLEGQNVEGLADGIPYAATVENGSIELPFEASNILVGLPFESYAETARIEAGAADGTAQGKEKRTNLVVVSLWQSAYGEIGRFNEDQDEPEWTDIEYKERFDELQPIALQDGMFGPITLPAGYGKRGSLLFRQTKPLPFNVIGLFPQMHTQDR